MVAARVVAAFAGRQELAGREGLLDQAGIVGRVDHLDPVGAGELRPVAHVLAHLRVLQPRIVQSLLHVGHRNYRPLRSACPDGSGPERRSHLSPEFVGREWFGPPRRTLPQPSPVSGMIGRVDAMTDARGDALRVRLAADPVSVSAARRFVTDGLVSWERTALIDSATLCVSELAGNAALHAASTFMEIALQALGKAAVRVSVEDDGAVPAEVVAPRATFTESEGVDFSIDDEPTTGRGLAIVSVLAREWGVEHTPEGKRVWAELTENEPEHEVGGPRTDPVEDPAPAQGALPPGWALVRLAGLSGGAEPATGRASRRAGPRAAAHLGRPGQQPLPGPGGADPGPVDQPRACPLHRAAARRAGIRGGPRRGRHRHGHAARVQHHGPAAPAGCRGGRRVVRADGAAHRCLTAGAAGPAGVDDSELVGQIDHGKPPVSWADWLRSND